MSKIVFDIETAGVDFDTLEESTQENLLKNAQTEEEKQDIREGLALSPLTGTIIAIGMLDCETDQGTVFFQNNNQDKENFRKDNSEYIICSEREILENFWKKIKRYNQFITYNGRTFDCPFIMIRSGVLKVKPTKDLMPYRYDTKIHIDLYDQLTFYGAMRRHFSLHMVTQAFGIKSPKDEGISGEQVSDLFAKGKCKEIASYCMRDVRATKQLYLEWEKYIQVDKR